MGITWNVQTRLQGKKLSGPQDGDGPKPPSSPK